MIYIRPIDLKKRAGVKKDVLCFLNKLKRPTTVGEINSRIGYNSYLIKIGVQDLLLEDRVRMQGRYISLNNKEEEQK